jgi:hypothetical protein
MITLIPLIPILGYLKFLLVCYAYISNLGFIAIPPPLLSILSVLLVLIILHLNTRLNSMYANVATSLMPILCC